MCVGVHYENQLQSNEDSVSYACANVDFYSTNCRTTVSIVPLQSTTFSYGAYT